VDCTCRGSAARYSRWRLPLSPIAADRSFLVLLARHLSPLTLTSTTPPSLLHPVLPFSVVPVGTVSRLPSSLRFCCVSRSFGPGSRLCLYPKTRRLSDYGSLNTARSSFLGNRYCLDCSPFDSSRKSLTWRPFLALHSTQPSCRDWPPSNLNRQRVTSTVAYFTLSGR
jgi:hypothetical protein